MDSEKLFEKLVNNEISREEFEALLDQIDDEQLRARYDEYLYSLFMDEVKTHQKEISSNRKQDQKNHSVAKSDSKGTYRKYYSIAATLLIISGFVYYLLLLSPAHNMQNAEETVTAEASQIEIKNTPTKRMFRTRLTDGSFVHLNAVSSISYPKSFAPDKREVKITGEAYFDINRDENRPFIINVKDFQVEVLGTSFNVRAYDDDDFFSVVVESGSVRVILNHEEEVSVIMTKNQKITYSVAESRYEITEVNLEEELSWRQGILRFNATPMLEVEKMLERWYGVEVIIEDSSIYKKSLTGIHQNENIKSVLESLTYATGTKYTIRNNVIIIKK